MSINRVMISGNLTRDAEIRSTQSGMAILGFGVAVNDRRTWDERSGKYRAMMEKGVPEHGVWKIGLARLSDGKSEVVCWNRPAGAPDPSGAIRLTTWRDEKKKLTAYHAEIPLSLFRESVKSGELACHFNLIVNDNDGPLREGYLAVAPGMGTEENPFLWTPLTL